MSEPDLSASASSCSKEATSEMQALDGPLPSQQTGTAARQANETEEEATMLTREGG